MQFPTVKEFELIEIIKGKIAILKEEKKRLLDQALQKSKDFHKEILSKIFEGQYGSGDLFYVPKGVYRLLYLGDASDEDYIFAKKKRFVSYESVFFPECMEADTYDGVLRWKWAEVMLTEENTSNQEMQVVFDLIKISDLINGRKGSVMCSFPSFFQAKVEIGEVFHLWEYLDCDHFSHLLAIILPSNRVAIVSISGEEYKSSKITNVVSIMPWHPQFYEHLFKVSPEGRKNFKLSKSEREFLKAAKFIFNEQRTDVRHALGNLHI